MSHFSVGTVRFEDLEILKEVLTGLGIPFEATADGENGLDLRSSFTEESTDTAQKVAIKITHDGLKDALGDGVAAKRRSKYGEMNVWQDIGFKKVTTERLSGGKPVMIDGRPAEDINYSFVCDEWALGGVKDEAFVVNQNANGQDNKVGLMEAISLGYVALNAKSLGGKINLTYNGEVIAKPTEGTDFYAQESASVGAFAQSGGWS